MWARLEVCLREVAAKKLPLFRVREGKLACIRPAFLRSLSV